VAEARSFNPDLGFASQAKPGLLSGGLSSMQETSCYGFNPPGSKKGLALLSGARNPVSTGSIATQFDADASSVSRVGRLWEVTAATAIFSLSIRSVRLKHRAVNTKPSPKYFVKLERFEACARTKSAAQFSFSPKHFRATAAFASARCLLYSVKKGELS
jgi:hypothetical protein